MTSDSSAHASEASLAIAWKSNGGNRATGVATAKLGEHVFTDTLTITSDQSRRAFVEKLVDRWPGLGEDREQIRAELDRIAASEADVDRSSHGDDKLAKRVITALRAEGVELFHDLTEGSGSRTFLSAVNEAGRLETIPLGTGASEEWIGRFAFTKLDTVLSSQVMQEVTATLRGIAMYEGAARKVGLRITSHDDVVWLDLCDDECRAVRVDAEGWRVVDSSESPVRFYRRSGMLPLPQPRKGGGIAMLREFVNVQSEQDWTLLLGFIVGMFAPSGPYPILELNGEPGSAKSSTARLIRSLIDPNRAPLRSQPRDERDVFIAAANGHVFTLDNLSRMPRWLSDALCRISTGGGFSTRKLYSDDAEQIFQVCRPIIMTGIGNIASESDLLDRSIRLTLDPIPVETRRTEAALEERFAAAHSRILGAVLDAVSIALKRRASITLNRLPRLADWATWATAAESGFGLVGGVTMAAFDADRATANIDAIESSPIGPALLAHLDQCDGEWSGTATELLDHLNALCLPEPRRWPTSPKTLGSQLSAISGNLRAIGFDIRKAPVGHARTRLITISRGQAVGRESFPLSAFLSAGIGPCGLETATADNADNADKQCAPPSVDGQKQYWEEGA